MSMLSAECERLYDRADELRMLVGGMRAPYIIPSTKETMALAMQSAAFEMREAADTIISLRDGLQAVGETCSIEWRDDSHDTDDGREHDGAYFCTKCGADLPYPLQECWDDYQALVADYGNVLPWNDKPFNHCPNCGRKVVDE